MEMAEVALFMEFKESNPSVQISFTMFSKLKPWYIRMNTIQYTCCFRYHVEFQLYYDTFVDFCKKHWYGEPTPHTMLDFISMILCNRNPENVFFIKRCVGGKDSMNVVIWHCSIGSFLLIQHTLDCQISQLSGEI